MTLGLLTGRIGRLPAPVQGRHRCDAHSFFPARMVSFQVPAHTKPPAVHLQQTHRSQASTLGVQAEPVARGEHRPTREAGIGRYTAGRDD